MTDSKNDEKIFFKAMKCDDGRCFIQAYSICEDVAGGLSYFRPITVNLSEYELPDLTEAGFYTFFAMKKQKQDKGV